MAASETDFFTKVGDPGTATTMTAPGHSIGGTSISVVSTANYPTTTGVIFAIDSVTIVNGEEVRNVGSYTEWEGTVGGATTLENMVLRYGTDQNYSAGATTRVYIPVSSSRENRLVDGLLVSHDQDGTLKTAAVQEALNIPTTPTADWSALANTPDTVTYNGQRSYSLVFNGVDYTDRLSPGQRVRTTRTVAAPTQCTSLNGSSQFWSKTSPNKLTFTDDFVIDTYVKISAYSSGDITIVSRFDGNNGWLLQINPAGQVKLVGVNNTTANTSYVISNQSVPLNKWVRITAQLDMSTFTATTTTSYIMLDGVDIPATVGRTGLNPTALVQAGNLLIGAGNSGTPTGFFPGKIAQVAIYNAKVTQANIILTHSQGLVGTETSLASAYSFDGVATDLNTTTPNDLTAQASAGYTADSPFGTQGSGLISSTLDYGIIQSATFSANTTVVVQVPDGCAIPTSGGIAAIAYSGLESPYGFRKIDSVYAGNGGTVGGAQYYSNINGVKKVWGYTIASAAAGNRTIILPSGLFSSLQHVSIGIVRRISAIDQIIYVSSATTVSGFSVEVTGGGTTTISWQVIGS